MVKTYYVRISEGRGCTVTVSDEPWKGDVEVTEFSAVTPLLLNRAAERKFGIPWCIAETPRLLIRELQAEDLSALQAMDRDALAGPAEEHFSDAGFLEAYIRNQYGFYGFGIWGIVRREDGQLIGKAGLSVPAEEWPAEELPAEPMHTAGESPAEKMAVPGTETSELVPVSTESDVLELSYQIAEPYRRQGFAFEACSAILHYGMEELDVSRYLVRIRKENIPSARLAEKLYRSTCHYPAGHKWQGDCILRSKELKTPLPQTERRFQVCISYYP